jgi:hypothetical protein
MLTLILMTALAPMEYAGDEAQEINALDLEKQMVIVVYAGEKRTGGYSVEVKSLEVKDKKLIVHWKLNSPGPDDIVTQAITHPQLVLLVDRFDGEVVFDPPFPKK